MTTTPCARRSSPVTSPSRDGRRSSRRWSHWLDRECCVSTHSLVEQLKGGLDAPICLTWELTYACNLACVHCLSSSGRRDPRELTTAEAKAVLDELAGLQVFYLNIGGGEPMIRRDFFELVDHAVGNGIGIKFSTNGTYLPPMRTAAGGDGLPRRADQPRRGRRGDQRSGARRRVVRRRSSGDGAPGRRRSSDRSRSRSS